MTKEIPSISFEEIEAALNLTDITSIYQVGKNLRITAAGKMHKLPLAETLDRLGVDLAGRRLQICSQFGHWLTFDTRAQPSIYELARRAVEERAACFPDETVIIWEGEEVKVRVYRAQDQLLMDLTNGEPKLAERVQIGLLTPSGWRFSLTAHDYSEWVKKARRLI